MLNKKVGRRHQKEGKEFIRNRKGKILIRLKRLETGSC
jgi:hypothetical protein